MSCSVCRQPGHKRGSEKCQPVQADTVETAWIKATCIPADQWESVDPFADDEPISPLSAEITARVLAANKDALLAASRAKFHAAVERSRFQSRVNATADVNDGVFDEVDVVPSDHDDVAAHLVSTEAFEKVNLANVAAKFGNAMDDAAGKAMYEVDRSFTTRQEAIVANLETIRDAIAALAVLFNS